MNKITSVLLALLALAVIACAVLFGVNRVRQNGGDSLPRPDTPPQINDSGNSNNGANESPVIADQEHVALDFLSRSKIGWGPGREVNDKNQPKYAIEAQEKYGKIGGHFIFPDDNKTIYLTFDLGYENGYTEKILDALLNHKAKGTFFITMDYVKEAPMIVERIIREGHTLANHTVKHPSIPDISDQRLKDEITGLHNFINEKYGYEMTLFRYPKGEFSEYTIAHINNIGYQSIFWSFAYKDWVTDAQPDPASAIKRVQEALHPGAIYLLHSVSSTNAQIMDEFLAYANAEGYNFGLVNQKLGLVNVESKIETILN